MEPCYPSVLVVAPGARTRGGIASVVRLHQASPVWREMDCELLSTYDDSGTARKLWAALRAYLRLPRKLLGRDIVHIHLAAQLSLLRKLPIVVVARLFGKKLIVHVHASSPESLFESTPGWAVRYVFESADTVLALSKSWAALIRKQLPRTNVRVLPNPVMQSPAPKPYACRGRVVLFVGKLEERKGYRTLLEAAPFVLKRHPEVQFWFAGHGELAEAAMQAERLGITASVRLLGWTDPDELSALYQDASVCCLPSFNEGLPMCVLEAMSHGAPVVCTPVGGLPELIEDGRTGLFAAAGDPASIAGKIGILLDDPERASEMAQAAQQQIQQTCGLAVVTESLRKIYFELAGQPGAEALCVAKRTRR